MSKSKKSVVNVWTLTSGLFILYGTLILGAGLYYLTQETPPPSAQYHPSIWWGGVILIAGFLFLWLSRRSDTAI